MGWFLEGFSVSFPLFVDIAWSALDIHDAFFEHLKYSYKFYACLSSPSPGTMNSDCSGLFNNKYITN